MAGFGDIARYAQGFAEMTGGVAAGPDNSPQSPRQTLAGADHIVPVCTELGALFNSQPQQSAAQVRSRSGNKRAVIGLEYGIDHAQTPFTKSPLLCSPLL